MDKEELRQKVIKEQDMMTYFAYNFFEEDPGRIDGTDLQYSNLAKEFFASNLDIMPELSINNLVYLLQSMEEEVSEAARDEIMKKFEAGEHVFSGENAMSSAFGFTSYIWNSPFSRLGKENIQKVIARIEAEQDALKDTDSRAYEVSMKFAPYAAIDNFLSYYEKGVFTPEKLDLIDRLVTTNPNILQKMNFGIFEDNIFEMGEEFVSRIARFPNFSNNLIRLARNNPKAFDMLKEYFVELEKETPQDKALELEKKTLSALTRHAFELGDEDFDLTTFQNYVRREKDFFNDVHVPFSKDYEEEYRKACDERYKTTRNIDKKKNILLSRYYGITSSEAKKFQSRYIRNISQLNLPEGNLLDYATAVDRVLQIEDEAELDKLYASIETTITPMEKVEIEYESRHKYTQTIIDEVSKTGKEVEETEDVEYIDVGGKKVKQVRLGSKDFTLLVHSTDSGFKEEKEIPGGDFLRAWKEQKDASAHLASTCYINQDFMGHVQAGGNGVLVAFLPTEVSTMGPTDIDSNITSYDCSAAKSMYMTADNLAQTSRRIYSEVPVPRTTPNFVVIFDDTPEQVLENSYKAAADFGATIIYMDKREIEERQIQKLDSMMEEFKKTGDLSVLQNLVSTYETNVAGWLLNRDMSEPDDSFTKGIDNERFRADFEARENAIYSLIADHVKARFGTEGYTQELQAISQIMQSEIDKYELTDLGNAPLSKVKQKFNAVGIKDKIDMILEGLGEKTDVSPIKTDGVFDFEAIALDSVMHDGIAMEDLQRLTTLKEKAEEKTKESEGQDYGE